MSMTSPTFNPFGATRTALVDVAPGSTIEVTDNEKGEAPYQATVIELKREYGPNAIPALIVLPIGSHEQRLITDSGKWSVVVLEDARLLAENSVPQNLVHVRTKPVLKSAIQYLGGVDSAVEIIKWSGGKAAVTWEQQTQEADEHLTVHTAEGPLQVPIGHWVIEGVKGEIYPCAPDVFVATYDVLEQDSQGAAQSLIDMFQPGSADL